MSRAQLTSTVEQNTGGAVAPFLAGKNKIINGDFGVWQRGTSFSNPANQAYTADRYLVGYDGTGATRTISQQTFTPGTAPVSGYEGTYFYRYNQSVAGSGSTFSTIETHLEDVRLFAGQTITLSFWAKAASGFSTNVLFRQNFGSGGSANVDTASSSITIGTTWQRYTTTVTLPSISGKTIGTSSSLFVMFFTPINATFTFDIWGVQLEAGSVATPFTTASNTLQGELALCQRYYWRISNVAQYDMLSNLGTAYSTTSTFFNFPIKQTMRVKPTSLDYANIAMTPDDVGTSFAISGMIIYHATPENVICSASNATATQYRPYLIYASSATAGASYVGFSAEL
jgi:hypothetical protein